MSKGKRKCRLKRHIAMYKATGEPSEWLMRQCLERRDVCEKVLPGLVGVIYPPERVSFAADLNKLSHIYFDPRIAGQFNKTSLIWRKLKP